MKEHKPEGATNAYLNEGERDAVTGNSSKRGYCMQHPEAGKFDADLGCPQCWEELEERRKAGHTSPPTSEGSTNTGGSQ